VLGVLGIYAATSLLYSLLLKRLIMLDIVTLACLYGVRLVLGSVATGVHLSGWLGMFSLFLFGCLALSKRMTELAHARAQAALKEGTPAGSTLAGRGYQSGDEPLLAAMAAGAGMVAVLVFALYAASPDVRMLYHAPSHLWLVCPVMFYWIGRVLMLAHRGALPADPVIFAVTDAVSLLSIVVAAGIVASAV
jgi:4-hydroxybenzoate polyprenyltransferase